MFETFGGVALVLVNIERETMFPRPVSIMINGRFIDGTRWFRGSEFVFRLRSSPWFES